MSFPSALLGAAWMVVALPIVLAPPAHAEEGERAEEAHSLFVRATQALSEGRPEEARALLRRSLELAPRQGTAFNLALVLRRTGDAVEAAELLGRLIGGEWGSLDAERLADARATLAEVERQVATVRIRVFGPVDEVQIALDAEERGALRRGEERALYLDAGEHRFLLHADGFAPRAETVRVTKGEVRTVSVTMRAVPSPASRDGNARAGSRGVSRWVWVVVGVAASGAAALTAGLLVRRGGSSLPEDPVTGQAITLRF